MEFLCSNLKCLSYRGWENERCQHDWQRLPKNIRTLFKLVHDICGCFLYNHSLRSKRSRTLSGRTVEGEQKNIDEAGGGGASEERLPANPWILIHSDRKSEAFVLKIAGEKRTHQSPTSKIRSHVIWTQKNDSEKLSKVAK